MKAYTYARLAFASLIGAGACGTASAQTANLDEQAAEESGGSGVADIVVTAQRRSESSQKVPIAIAAFSGDTLVKSNVLDTTALNGKAPSLSITLRGPQNVMFIRGIGANGIGPNAEQSVATYIDGVYIYSTTGNMFPLNNVERIEILKGPQGTLFGRNATGGVINIITKDPTVEPALEAHIGYANYNTKTADLYATTGLSSNLAVDVAMTYRDQGKGWGRNLTRDEPTYLQDDFSIRSKLLWNASDSTQVRAGLTYTKQKSSGFNQQLPRGVAGIDGVPRDLDPYDTVGADADSWRARTYTASLQIDHDFGGAKLVSISAYRNVEGVYYTDQDSTPTPLVRAWVRWPSENYTQELRLSGDSGDGRFEWMVGGFYLYVPKAAVAPLHLEGLVVAPLPDLAIYTSQRTRSTSAFGQVSYRVTDTTKLTAGFRYTWEKIRVPKAYTTSNDVFVGDIAGFVPAREKVPTWRLSIDQEIGSNSLLYASYNRGFKSGGFNIGGAGASPSFGPERLDAFEIGMKNDLFNRMIRLNLGAYLYKFKDIQVQLTVPGGENIANAAAATMKGIEAELQVVPTRNLNLGVSFAIADGQYDSYPQAQGFPASPTQGPGFSFDAKGQRTIYTPKYSGNVSIDYTKETSIGEMSFAALLTFTASSFVQPTNRLKLTANRVMNMSIGWTSLDERFNARLWASNLFDERYFSSRLESGLGDIQIFAPPRTYGLTLGVKY